jgi:uncharacterized membrane protein YccF (DUF307 family)
MASNLLVAETFGAGFLATGFAATLLATGFALAGLASTLRAGIDLVGLAFEAACFGITILGYRSLGKTDIHRCALSASHIATPQSRSLLADRWFRGNP